MNYQLSQKLLPIYMTHILGLISVHTPDIIIYEDAERLMDLKIRRTYKME